jgi:hypothetical protein
VWEEDKSHKGARRGLIERKRREKTMNMNSMFWVKKNLYMLRTILLQKK